MNVVNLKYILIQAWAELGPAQPQLLLFSFSVFYMIQRIMLQRKIITHKNLQCQMSLLHRSLCKAWWVSSPLLHLWYISHIPSPVAGYLVYPCGGGFVGQKIQLKDITRLESKVFSLERLFPLFQVEVSEAKTNIGSKILFGSTRILWVRKNFVSKTNF